MNKYADKAASSRRERRLRNGCTSKMRFATRLEAEIFNPAQLAYACKFCKGWHLTSSISKTLAVVRSRGRRAIIHR